MRTIIPPDANSIPPNAKKVFSGQIFDVYQWPQEMFDGSVATFEMIGRIDTVQVIAIRDGKLVITEEQQPNTKAFYGIPGGRHDREDETELQAAQRELLEETGLRFKTWKLVKVFNPIMDTKKIDWLIYVFVATDFIDETEPQPDAGEKISVHYMDFDEYINTGPKRGSNHTIDRLFKQAGNIDGILNLPEYKV